jgi:hypothetical protein
MKLVYRTFVTHFLRRLAHPNQIQPMKISLMARSICVVLLLGFLSTLNAADLRLGLVGYYQMDALDGINLPDATPYSNHMRAVNIAGGSFVAGQFGNAVSLVTSAATYMTNLHSPDPTTSGLPIYRNGSYSITMWVKGPAQTNRYLYAEGSTTSNNPLLILQTGAATNAGISSRFDVIIRNDAGSALVNHVTSSAIVFDNNWHHIAWVDDRGSVKLYIDGNLDPAAFNYTPAGAFTMNTTAIGTLVRAAIATGNVFNGLIDDMALWKRALSSNEVQQMRTNSLMTPIPTFPPIVLTDPVGRTNHVGDRVTFSAVVDGGTPLIFQWLKNGAIVPGATAPVLSLSNLVTGDSGGYSLWITNAFGSSTSAVATLFVIPDPTPDLASGIVSWWSMDDEPGNELGQNFIIDPYGHNDMLAVGPGDFIDLTPGFFNNAIQFNGQDQYLRRYSGFPIYNNPAYSVAFWVNASASQADRRIFAESSTNGGFASISIGSHTNGTSGTLRVLIRNPLGNIIMDRYSTRVALDDNWHHVAWTETNGEARLYIDGVLDDTNFNYTRVPLVLETTTIGALQNVNGASNFLNGIVDEVSVWSRIISLAEIQALRSDPLMPPVADSKPTVTAQPLSRAVFTRANVTFRFAASGTGPLFWNWRKDGTNLPGQTNATLSLINVTLADAGDYDIVVTNTVGGTTSQVAVLSVTLRPVTTDLKIDFNNLGVDDSPASTMPGFQSFVLDVPITPGPVTRPYGGAVVTVAGAGGVNLQSRKRATPINTVDFTEERLLQDFIFSPDSVAGQGIDVTIEFLEANLTYMLTIWSYDQANNSRFSDWTANSVTLTNGYTFVGSVNPVNNEMSRIVRLVTADANGTLVIQGRRGTAATVANNVFLNALRVAEFHEVRVLETHLTSTNTLRLFVGGINPNANQRIQQKPTVTDPTWTILPEATFGAPNGNTIEAIIPLTGDTMQFYRVIEVPR